MRHAPRPLPIGAVLGVLGAGQLGRMFAAAAVQHGYRVHVFAPDAEGSPTAAHAECVVAADWGDESSLRRFARRCDAVTLEFENVPPEALRTIQDHAPVRPGPETLAVCRHRIEEKRFLASHGLPTVAWDELTEAGDAAAAYARIGAPLRLKTAGYGYDGKGQARAATASEAEAAHAAIGGGHAIAEAEVELTAELSVVAARDASGSFRAWPPFRNDHVGGVLDLAVTPAGLPDSVLSAAEELARTVCEKLDLVGVACVEFFLLASGELLVNEIAPRPHNSGHGTIHGSTTSQFEQQLRVLAGLPLGDVTPRGASAIANLLGDLWQDGEPDAAAALAIPGAKLHLYGKREARPGRKMGHLEAVAPDPATARATVVRARHAFAGAGGR